MVSKNKAFTIIELSVVLAIMLVLSVLVIRSIVTRGASVRDGQRMEDIKNLQYLVEKYKVENGSYPSTGGAWWRGHSTYGWTGATVRGYGATGYITGLVPDYIAELPEDPNNSNSGAYMYRSNGVDYIILAYRTVESVNPCDVDTTVAGSQNHPMVRSIDCNTTFAVYSDGARTW